MVAFDEAAYMTRVDLAALAVRRGDDANWELARLTDENTLDGPADQPGRVSMERWCQDVRAAAGRRFSPTTGTIYKRIHRAHADLAPAERPAWTEAYYAATTGSKEDNDERRALSEARNARPEIKAQMIRELAGDAQVPSEAQQAAFQTLAARPAVAEEVANFGSATSRAVVDLNQRAHEARVERRERREQADPVARQFAEQRAVLDLQSACARFTGDIERFAREVAEIMPRTGLAGADELFWIREVMERSRSVLAQVERYVETGRSDIDTFLAEVLSKGETRG